MARTHLVWDWNGTLLDDLSLVVSSTNHTFAAVGGRSVDSDEHRRRFRWPVAEFYAEILERAVDAEEFEELDRIFHEAYRVGLTTISLAADAEAAIRAWPGGQSLLSMWFHDELIPAVQTYGLAQHVHPHRRAADRGRRRAQGSATWPGTSPSSRCPATRWC
nr:hypothetical protein GCM10020092_009190 [Actinoplanes digitatis]